MSSLVAIADATPSRAPATTKPPYDPSEHLRVWQFQKGHAAALGSGRPGKRWQVTKALDLLDGLQRVETGGRRRCACRCSTLREHFLRRAFTSDSVLVAVARKFWPDITATENRVQWTLSFTGQWQGRPTPTASVGSDAPDGMHIIGHSEGLPVGGGEAGDVAQVSTVLSSLEKVEAGVGVGVDVNVPLPSPAAAETVLLIPQTQ